MAQRTEKEETEFKVVPETISLCVKCGVAANSAANNLCLKCFNAAAAAASAPSVSTFKSCKPTSPSLSLPDRKPDSGVTSRDLNQEASSAVRREVNRCTGCRRKVGLTGFRCRCGELFCADHRYSDRHDCSYDYKSAGREAIARDNPVVKAAKIVKI